MPTLTTLAHELELNQKRLAETEECDYDTFEDYESDVGYIMFCIDSLESQISEKISKKDLHLSLIHISEPTRPY